jgi:signal transduction histidine kinase
MSDTERRRAFDRFYRTDFARQQALPGVGLGLSIARNLADANGVSIELEPASTGGTCARLTLPPAIAPVDATA